MRPLLLSLALLVAACSSTAPRPPPSDRFIYPSGLVHRSVPGSTNGILYVASANFDRCFDEGTLMAVDLDRVGSDTNRLPALGAATGATPLTLEQLNVAPESLRYIQSYAGEMAVWNRPDGAPRLFIPTRADGDFVHYVDIPEPTRLSCVGTESNNCINGALSLDNPAGQTNDAPRASAPFGVAVSPEGQVWVTHLGAVDSPARSGTNWQSYVVRLPGDTPAVSAADFTPLSAANLAIAGSNSVVVGERYVFVTGRFISGINTVARRFLVRVLDRTNLDRLIDPGLDVGFAALDARGLALTRKVGTSQRLYVATRSPDSLVLVDVQGIEPASDSPRLTLVGSVPLPSGPTEVTLVSRGDNRSELVVVACSTAGVVAIFDPDVGQVVAQVQVGEQTGTSSAQPFGLAVQQQANAARIFVSNFGDGRVSVIDIADLANPQLARLVARLGARQDVAGSSTCQEVQQ